MKFKEYIKEDKKQVLYYIDKWNSKMKGSTIDTAIGWVKGIGELSKKDKEQVLKSITGGKKTSF